MLLTRDLPGCFDESVVLLLRPNGQSEAIDE